MSLTLVTNPISGTETIFAGLQPIEFVFKREDLAITSVTSGTGGIKINHLGDLTSYLSAGDIIYVYSAGTNYTYDGTGTILTIVAGEITIDIPYVESATGGYINYFKNYYVEMQIIDPDFTTANLLGFNLENDGDAAGNIIIDVSIANDLNIQRGNISTGHLSDSVQEFEIQYRQVYTGSSESYTHVNNKMAIVVYCTETPAENEILNQFDLPKIYLGYPAGICIANSGGTVGNDIDITYNELDINNNSLASDTLGVLDQGLNGFLLWGWDKDTSVDNATKYINFDVLKEAVGDFADPNFDTPDFKIT